LLLAISGRHDFDLSIGADFNTDYAQPCGDHGLKRLGYIALVEGRWSAWLRFGSQGFTL
jgi:hypothetical protein